MLNVKCGGMFARLGSLLRGGGAPSAGEVSEHIRRGASRRGADALTPGEIKEALGHLVRRCCGPHTHDRHPWTRPHCGDDVRPMPYIRWHCHGRPHMPEQPIWRVPLPDADPCDKPPVMPY